MKKLNYILAILAMALGMITISCGPKSNSDLIKDFEATGNAAIDALIDGDQKKAEELWDECERITHELEQRDLTSKEQKEFLQAGMALMQKAVKYAGELGLDFMNLGLDMFDENMEITTETIEEYTDGIEEWSDNYESAMNKYEDAYNAAAKEYEDALDKAAAEMEAALDAASASLDVATETTKTTKTTRTTKTTKPVVKETKPAVPEAKPAQKKNAEGNLNSIRRN